MSINYDKFRKYISSHKCLKIHIGDRLIESNINIANDGDTPIYVRYDRDTQWTEIMSNDIISLPCDCTDLFSRSEIEIIDLTGFDTSHVINMTGLFSECLNLKKVIFGNIKTKNLAYMKYMFLCCKSLSYIEINLDLTRVVDMTGMFAGCDALVEANFKNTTTKCLRSMSRMFEGCLNLKSVSMTNFNTSIVLDMSNMFFVCSSLTSLDLSNFTTYNAYHMENMFYNCRSLKSINVSRKYFAINDRAKTKDALKGCINLDSSYIRKIFK